MSKLFLFAIMFLVNQNVFDGTKILDGILTEQSDTDFVQPVKGGLLAKLPAQIHDALQKINPEASDSSYGF